jgi:hypothetical protein
MSEVRLIDEWLVLFNDYLFGPTWPLYVLSKGEPAMLSSQQVMELTFNSPVNDATGNDQWLFIARGDILNGYPAAIDTYSLRSGSPVRTSSLSLQTDPVGLAMRGTQVLAVSYDYEIGVDLVVYDVESDGSLAEAHRVPTGINAALEALLVRDTLYMLTNGAVSVFRFDADGLPVPVGAGISDPRLVNAFWSGLAADDERLFVATGSDDALLAVDTSDLANLRIVATLSTSSFADEVALTPTQVLASALSEDGVWSFDRSARDPLQAPRPLPLDGVEGIDTLSGTEIVIGVTDDRITVDDVTEPLAPAHVGSAQLASLGNDVAAAGDIALIERLELDIDFFFPVVDVFDLRDRSTPVRAAELGPTAGHLTQQMISSDHAFIPTNDGIAVIDVSDLGAVRRVGHVPLRVRRPLVVARGSWLYAVSHGEVAVFDISSPAAPVAAGSITIPNVADIVDVALADDLLLVLGEDGLLALSVGEPARPAVVDHGLPLWIGRDLAVDGDLAYVADGPAGVSVWRLPEPSAAPAHRVFIPWTGR